MCGIAGVLSKSESGENLTAQARIMADAMTHRGPDSSGLWLGSGIALSQRRLSILDLSPAGHQPMISRSGRFVISYNGEIYNFKSLRSELESEGFSFVSGSDTEVILAGVERWGLERTLDKSIGMFAFALWDTKEKTLSLARDRFGVKPLYYTRAGDRFAFASESRAFRALSWFDDSIDDDAARAVITQLAVPSPYSIYKSVSQLPAGKILRFDQLTGKQTIQTWWDSLDVAQRAMSRPFSGSFASAVDELDVLLSDAVGLRMISDVPLGSFLSGGIDSTLVTAMMRKISNGEIKTFNVGFHSKSFDESTFSQKIAETIGTNHLCFRLSEAEFLEIVPQLSSIYDEPFADSSQIGMFAIAKVAKTKVTVALSGDGGDEFFGGYNRYQVAAKWHQTIKNVPVSLRRLGASIIKSGEFSNKFWGLIDPALAVQLDRKLPKIYRALGATTELDFYRAMAHAEVKDLWTGDKTLRMNPRIYDCFSGAVDERVQLPEKMMLADVACYLTDDVLTKVDRASMAVSLESREPLLDHRLFEFAWKLPLHFKIDRHGGKKILREVLYRYVSKGMVDRPKAGFAVPIGTWLKSSLKEWGWDRIQSGVNEFPWLNVMTVEKIWRAHQSGRMDATETLWPIIMLADWRIQNRRSSGAIRAL